MERTKWELHKDFEFKLEEADLKGKIQKNKEFIKENHKKIQSIYIQLLNKT